MKLYQQFAREVAELIASGQLKPGERLPSVREARARRGVSAATVFQAYQVLERDGRFEVKTAGTGYDAGMITQEFNPDLIILDYMLPDVNGNVVCKTIRTKPEYEHTKIIIVSGVVNQDEINDLLKAGADEFVKKPFNIEKLIERIGELLTV